jgi:hypothetical protein
VFDDGQMNERVGNAQRTHVLDLLSKALEEGYLDLAECDQRTKIVASAKTVHQLQGQLADLPPRFQWHPGATPPPMAPMAAAAVSLVPDNERVGTAQRTEVLDLLSKALEEGYLDLTEFDQRMNSVTSAKAAHQLQAQLTDLPPRFLWNAGALPAPFVPATAQDPKAHTSAVASLVLGIASVLLSVCCGVGFLFGVAAIVLSRFGMRSANDRGKAMAGLVLGCVGVAASIGMVLLLMFAPAAPTAP